jgi:hypothetical protein
MAGNRPYPPIGPHTPPHRVVNELLIGQLPAPDSPFQLVEHVVQLPRQPNQVGAPQASKVRLKHIP